MNFPAVISRLPVLCIVLGLWLGPPGLEASEPVLTGAYELVAIRKTNLAMAGPQDPSLASVRPGDRFEFGETLTWLAGERCGDWRAEPVTDGVIDPGIDMLSDTQVTAARLDEGLPDHRANRHWRLHCGVQVRAPVLQVDGRVIVVPSPSMQSYLLFEKPADGELARAVQVALTSMKFREGEPTGAMDADTRRSLGFFADYLGADYAFNASPLTENLLEALGLARFVYRSPFGQWTPDDVAYEMARYRFSDRVATTGDRWVVLSGFIEGDAPRARSAVDEVRAFLAGLPNLDYSALADAVTLWEVQRSSERCDAAPECLVTGHVVTLGPVDAVRVKAVCELFHANEAFCAAP